VVKLNLMTQLERRKKCDKLHLFFVHGNILRTKFHLPLSLTANLKEFGKLFYLIVEK